MFSDTRPFSSATYTCDSGFGLVGQSVRTCEQSGSWSREPPVCVASVSYTSPPKSDTSTSSSSSGVSIGVAIAVLVLVGTVVLVVARVWFLLHRHRSLSRVSHQRSSPPVPTIPAHETTISHPPLSNPPLSTETKLAEESTFSASV
ncbi:hypothetical protein GBAR_LOCUS26681 [Geodia barretti]|nr:hypothetical protein GBAR_LOCUS26681 [Geodia barretti]